MSDPVTINVEPRLFDFGMLQLNFNVDAIQPTDRPLPEQSDSEVDVVFQSLGVLLKRLLQEYTSRTVQLQEDTVQRFLYEGDAWVSLALELFGWSKEVALAIVGVFEALHACYAPKDRVVESTYLKRFVLFLAVQVFALFPHGGTASADTKSQGIKWPTAAHAHIEHSPENDPTTQTNLAGRSLLLSALTSESEHRIRFFATYAQHFVWIASGAPDRDREDKTSQKSNNAAVDALEFVLKATKGSNMCDFKQAVKGLLVSTEKELPTLISEVLLSHLRQTPDATRAASNQEETLVIDAANKATKMIAPGANEGASKRAVVIKSCEHCHVYMLNAVENVRIVGCHNATVYLGPVTSTLCVDLCENVTVIAPTNLLVLKNSVDCKLYVYTKHRPLFSGDFRGILLGPYSSNYDELRDQLHNSKLAPGGTVPESENRLWKSPIVLQSVLTPKATSQIRTCTAQEFQLVAVPLRRDSSRAELLKSLAFELDPDLYEEQLKQLSRSQNLLEEMEREMDGNSGQKSKLIRIVNASFREWLLTSGNMKQVVDLVKLAQAGDSC